MPRLSGKTALVTGAASGIGAAIAKAYADEAVDVIVTDIDVERGHAVADNIGGTFARLDVGAEADWIEIARRFPTIDIVVNNAGITGLDGFSAHDPENARLANWRAVHSVDLDATLALLRMATRDKTRERRNYGCEGEPMPAIGL